jgi:glutamate racemase
MSPSSSSGEPAARRSGDLAPPILVFDSGIGGLSVLREIRRRRPDLELVYVADDAGFPYGAWPEAALIDRVVGLAGRLIEAFHPGLFVVACNTASTLVLPHLRRAHSVGFVGTVPAIKPAAASTRSGLISVLATPGTVARDYTRRLIETFAAQAEVTLVGSHDLAAIAEAELAGGVVDEARIAAEIAPCFREVDGRRTDRVVLACTHYPFLIERFRRLAPWPVEWIDPAPAIARRVAALVPPPLDVVARPVPGRALFTSGRAPVPALARVLADFGLGAAPAAAVER